MTNSPTPVDDALMAKINALAMKAIELTKPANENPGDKWLAKAASEAWSKFQNAATPEAWLVFSAVPHAPEGVVEKVKRAIIQAIQFQPPFGETRESNGDWVTTVGLIDQMEAIASLAASAALSALQDSKP